MQKFLITLEIEQCGFVVDFFDTEVEAELCMEKIIEIESKFSFHDMHKVADEFKNYLKKYSIPATNPYTCKFYRSTTNGSLTINIIKINPQYFNIDLYAADRTTSASAIDLLDDKYAIISERISDYFPSFFISAN